MLASCADAGSDKPVILFDPAARSPPKVALVIVWPDKVAPPDNVPDRVAPLIVGDVSVADVNV